MKRVHKVIVCWIWVLTFLLVGAGRLLATQDPAIQITPSETHPGEAILIRLTSERRIASIEAQLTGRKVMFFPEKSGKSWVALAGIDLDVTPKEHPLTYRLHYSDGSESAGKYPVVVRDKKYPVERVTVAKKFVDLSKEDLKRVAKEKKMLSSLYGVQSQETSWEQGFTVPVDVQRGSRFGLRRIFNGEPRSPHSGADLKAGAGTPVHAPDGGRTVFAGNLFFSGNTVILDHGGGLYTLYAHLSDFATRAGDTVKKGQVIGHVGATGRVTGPHLHWGAKLNGARVDPFSLVTLPLPEPVKGDKAASIGGPKDREKGTPSRGGAASDSEGGSL
jgi:murein DD-endopeptidase MepM/ murein hydrolase activator NlpD